MKSANLYLVINKFGDLVRFARLAKNLSQRELAQRIGKSSTYINYIERGINPSSKSGKFQPSIESVEAIAKALDIDLDDARESAGYARETPATVHKPHTAAEFVAALESLGVDSIQFFHERDLSDFTPEDFEEMLNAVRIAVEITISRKRSRQ